MHAVAVFERAVENRLAVARLADDAVGRPGADLHPVGLRVKQVEFVLLVVLELAADQGLKVERQAARFQRLLVLGRCAADLLRQRVDGLVEAIELGVFLLQASSK